MIAVGAALLLALCAVDPGLSSPTRDHARLFAAGTLARDAGLPTVFLWILVWLMLLNALVIGILYQTYPRDTDRVRPRLRSREAVVSPQGTM